MDNKVTVSIIVPSYNSYKTIGYTLEHILTQSAINMVKEIIVVDSSDDEFTVPLIKKFTDPRIQFITSGIRVMPAIQRNIGAQKATGDLFAFIDSDAYPAHDWLEKIIEAYGCGIKLGGGSYRVPEFQLKNKVALGQYYLEFNEFINAGSAREVRLLPSCNLFAERMLFHRVQGFPEIRASEDSLFGLKANKICPMIFLPQAAVFHIFRENREHFLNNQVLIGKYIYIYRLAFYKSFYLRRLLPLFIPAILFFKFLRIVLRIIKAGPGHFPAFIKSLPVFILGLLSWMKGFSGCRKEKELVDELKRSISLYLNT